MISRDESKEFAFAEYKNSVEALLEVTKLNGSGSRAAAQVLLSAYNGECFQVNVSDLGLLDHANLEHALRVIWGRVCRPWLEPHRAIDNGGAIFRQLWEEWSDLTVSARQKETCEHCPNCD